MSTLEERIAAYNAKVLAENADNQTKAAYAREKELGFDENYKILISSIKAGAKLANVAVPTKTATADAEWQAIWTERDLRVANSDLNLDYSAVSNLRTHSYTELKSELEAL